MTNPRRQLAIRGIIFLVSVALLFTFSRYIPQPLSAFAPAGEEWDDFDGIYSSSDKLSRFLEAPGPNPPAVFVLFSGFTSDRRAISGGRTGVVGGYVYGEKIGFLSSTLGFT